MWNDFCRGLRIRLEAVKARLEVTDRCSDWWRFDGTLNEKLVRFLVVVKGIDLQIVMIDLN
jgi:hypothetical protein